MKINYGSKEITINFDAISKGMRAMAKQAGAQAYECMDENKKAALAFGMLDHAIAEEFSSKWSTMLRRALNGKMQEIGIKPQYYQDFFPERYTKEILSECNKEFYLGALAAAKTAGKLLV